MLSKPLDEVSAAGCNFFGDPRADTTRQLIRHSLTVSKMSKAQNEMATTCSGAIRQVLNSRSSSHDSLRIKRPRGRKLIQAVTLDSFSCLRGHTTTYAKAGITRRDVRPAPAYEDHVFALARFLDILDVWGAFRELLLWSVY